MRKMSPGRMVRTRNEVMVLHAHRKVAYICYNWIKIYLILHQTHESGKPAQCTDYIKSNLLFKKLHIFVKLIKISAETVQLHKVFQSHTGIKWQGKDTDKGFCW